MGRPINFCCKKLYTHIINFIQQRYKYEIAKDFSNQNAPGDRGFLFLLIRCGNNRIL